MPAPSESTADPPPPRWSVEQRIAFAARRLYWDGAINREDLIRRFGVSANQATADIARLREAHPGAIAYDTVGRTYRADDTFAPAEADPARLLRELRLIAEGQIEPAAATLARLPEVVLADLPERAVDPIVLCALLRAIRDGQAVAGRYISFQRPGSSRRILSPHALVFDGFRWHVRAHDAGDDRFKDFVIARLSDLAPAGDRRATEAADAAWNQFVVLDIVPHPGLDRHQQSVIARDYGMNRRRLSIEVREAVLFYVRRRFGLTEGHEDRPAAEQHIILAGEPRRTNGR
jgi:predicted DNA-binding transcriptional regulator YafY